MTDFKDEPLYFRLQFLMNPITSPTFHHILNSWYGDTCLNRDDIGKLFTDSVNRDTLKHDRDLLPALRTLIIDQIISSASHSPCSIAQIRDIIHGSALQVCGSSSIHDVSNESLTEALERVRSNLLSPVEVSDGFVNDELDFHGFVNDELDYRDEDEIFQDECRNSVTVDIFIQAPYLSAGPPSFTSSFCDWTNIGLAWNPRNPSSEPNIDKSADFQRFPGGSYFVHFVDQESKILCSDSIRPGHFFRNYELTVLKNDSDLLQSLHYLPHRRQDARVPALLEQAQVRIHVGDIRVPFTRQSLKDAIDLMVRNRRFYHYSNEKTYKISIEVEIPIPIASNENEEQAPKPVEKTELKISSSSPEAPTCPPLSDAKLGECMYSCEKLSPSSTPFVPSVNSIDFANDESAIFDKDNPCTVDLTHFDSDPSAAIDDDPSQVPILDQGSVNLCLITKTAIKTTLTSGECTSSTTFREPTPIVADSIDFDNDESATFDDDNPSPGDPHHFDDDPFTDDSANPANKIEQLLPNIFYQSLDLSISSAIVTIQATAPCSTCTQDSPVAPYPPWPDSTHGECINVKPSPDSTSAIWTVDSTNFDNDASATLDDNDPFTNDFNLFVFESDESAAFDDDDPSCIGTTPVANDQFATFEDDDPTTQSNFFVYLFQ